MYYTNVLLVLALVFSLSARAEDNSIGKNLGKKNLNFTYQIWNPVENKIHFGDLTDDRAYADFFFKTDSAVKLWLKPGSTFGIGCDTSAVSTEYFLLQLDDNENVVNSVRLQDPQFLTGENSSYLIRVTFKNLKACSGYGTSLIAWIR